MRARRSIRAALATLALAATAVSVPAGATASCAPADHAGGDWPIYGHDLANTRSQPDETVITPLRAPALRPVFTVSSDDFAGGEGDFTGTPVIAGGCLFVGSNDGWVFAANADDGTPVWGTRVVPAGVNAGINSSLAVDGGTVYAAVSKVGAPYVVALDQTTGAVGWTSAPIDTQAGVDVYSSPVVFDGLVFLGFSGGAAELGDEADRHAFQGGFVLLDATDGSLVKKTWSIRAPDPDPEDPADDFAGAAIWSTPAIDPASKTAWVGTGNPFRPQAEHDHANAILKIDLDRGSPTFGEIVGFYHGVIDEYLPHFSEIPCQDIPGNPPPYYPQGIGECGDIDLDFGASPNLFELDGRLVVGEGQKAGVYHVVDAADMTPVYTQVVGNPGPLGGIVGSTAYDGDSIYGPITMGGYLWSIHADEGDHRWVSPTADGAHWGNPVTHAAGVVYTVDLKGFLDAYDAATGAPLLHYPMALGSGTGNDLVLSWGGVSVARNTVYAAVGITGLPNGHVVAFRPDPSIPEPPGPGDLPLPPVDVAKTIVSGPSAKYYTFLTPAMAIEPGDDVSILNVDLERHDVVQDVSADGFSGPDDQPWCEQFSPGACPTFWSELAPLGQTRPVLGLENLAPGQVYSFYCTIHPGMKGKIVAVPPM